MSSTEEGQSSGLRWTTERQHGLVTVHLHGELDLSAADGLRAALDAAAAAEQVTVVDLEGLEFMDSTGIRLFAQLHKAAQAAGRRFLLARPSTGVLRVLQVAGLIEHFDYVEGAPPRERLCGVCEELVATGGSTCPHCGSTL